MDYGDLYRLELSNHEATKRMLKATTHKLVEVQAERDTLKSQLAKEHATNQPQNREKALAMSETTPEATSNDLEDAVIYLVVDSRFSPEAAGTRDKCLAFIADKLSTQSDHRTLVNPVSYHLLKIRQL
jgi:hypothetical protein